MRHGKLHPLVERPGANGVRWANPFHPDHPLILHTACPSAYSPDTPILFVHHGDLRNGAEFRDYWLPLVDELQLLVISPEFPADIFPGSAGYALGNYCDELGNTRPRDQWTFAVPGQVFSILRAEGITRRRTFGVFGHSSGGQFVHRLISLGFRDGVGIAVTANAGTYAMPTLNDAFPYGLGGMQIGESDLRDLLDFPLVVLAGTADIDTASPHFPRDRAAMAQGPTRYDRAYGYMLAALQCAENLRVTCAWRMIDVPGVGHDGARMSSAAAGLLKIELHAAGR
jgi:hypothetical protein